MIFETLLTAAFYFAPFEISDDFPKWKTWILFFLMALVKLGSDLVNNLISVFAQKIFKIRYVKLYLAFSRLSSRLILFKVPVIIIYFEKHGLHPFLFGSLCWMACSVLCVFLNKIIKPFFTRKLLYKNGAFQVFIQKKWNFLQS